MTEPSPTPLSSDPTPISNYPNRDLLLARQVQLLEELRRIQTDQQAQLAALVKEQQAQRSELQAVKVVNFDMPFGALVGFIIKATIAAIPAYIILAIIGFVLTLFLGGFLVVLGAAFGG